MVKHLRWVPHSSTANEVIQCVTLANELLREIREIKSDDQ
jgi:hypothetical protein